jgi:hypothetical protein
MLKYKIEQAPIHEGLCHGSGRPLTADPGRVHLGFVVDKVALGQVFPQVLLFFPVSFIPPVHYTEKRKRRQSSLLRCCTISLKSCGASVASAAGHFTTHTPVHQSGKHNAKDKYIYNIKVIKMLSIKKTALLTPKPDNSQAQVQCLLTLCAMHAQNF